MTIATAAFATYGAIGNREDLTNIIYNIAPYDTPFMTRIGRSKANAVKHEWQTDTLAAAVSTNAQLEGTVIVGTATVATVRLSNYCQIASKDVVVTGTQEAVNKAGRDSEMTYQMAKRMKELKRDMETSLCSISVGLAGATGTARTLRGLAAFNNTNTNRYTASTSGTKGKNATAPTSATGAPTDAANTRALTELLLKKVLQQVYTTGGDPTFIMVGPHNKQTVSTFTGRSNARTVLNDKTIIQAAADMYASDYGDLDVFPNRFGRERECVVGDPEMAAVAFLRPPFVVDLAKVGDAIRKAIFAEFTLEMRNYGAFGVVADINTSS